RCSVASVRLFYSCRCGLRFLLPFPNDALPIWGFFCSLCPRAALPLPGGLIDLPYKGILNCSYYNLANSEGKREKGGGIERTYKRSEEHTSEHQSREKLVCRLLLEKKN